MARSFKVYLGEDETPVYDLTDATSDVHVIWDEIEAGGRAFKGESTQNSIPIRDEQGETGEDTDLPVGLTYMGLPRGSRWEWLDGPDGDEVIVAAGRIGPKDYSRGRQKADRAREITLQGADRNEELRNIIIDGESRPEETDVTRVLWLLGAYLNGSPRTTTVIADTYVATGNPITMPAAVYDGTTPAEVLSDIASFANKNFFVTVDDELFYDDWDSLAYPAGIRISDRLDDENITGTCSEGSSDTTRLYITKWQVEETPGGDGSADAPIVTADATWTTTATNVPLRMLSESDSSGPENGETSSIAQGALGGVNCLYRQDLFLLPTGGTLEGHVRGYSLCKTAVGIGVNEGIQDMQSQLVVRVAAPDGSIRGTALAAHNPTTRDSTAWVANVTAAQRKFPASNAWDDASLGAALTPVVYEAGDYLVIERGSRNFTPAGNNSGGNIRSTNNAGSDLPENETGTAQLNTWFEFTLSGIGAETLTFPPIWDVGPASTEDGMELLSGLRLYYGQNGNYVYVSHAGTAEDYWHSEKSVYTTDPAIADATAATTLAESILFRSRLEERTYNVSIGPLSREQIGCIKPGQMTSIKARAIPDADDQFVFRRIAQLVWTTPVPGQFYARMMLSRPIKEVPNGIGPKIASEAISNHAESATDAHHASAVTIVDSGGYFSGTSVEAALQELGAGTGTLPAVVTDHGSMGAAETFDFTDGSDHEGTQDADLTVTLSGATNGEAAFLTLVLAQDGTGGHTITLPPSVVNGSDVETAWDITASAVNILTLFSYDGGTTWYGFLAGSSGGGAASTTHFEPVQFNDGSAEWPFVYFNGEIVMAEVPN